ncbi:MAG: transcriptional regulator LysR family [Rhodospirillales bacterium]|jgi:DNA-binding transcriptional LysR family regulator|nr:transcriptional regulator LysR family [Rhodospirillales bacterium]
MTLADRSGRGKQVRRISLDSAELETFLAIAETGSFTKAAKLLALSQPSVSQRVHRLESELGTRLFDRTGRNVTLTDAGRRLRSRAESIVAEMRAMIAEFRDDQDARLQEVVVAASPMVAAVMLPPVVRLFRKLHPSATVHIHENSADAALDHLAAGRADIAVMVMEKHDARFEFEALADDECLVVAQIGHEVLRETFVDFDTIVRYPILLPGGQVPLAAAVAREFEKRGLEFRPTLTARTVQTMLGMVAAGIGITLVPSRVIRASAIGEIGTVRIAGAPLLRRFGIIQLRGRTRSHSCRAFCEVLKEQSHVPA